MSDELIVWLRQQLDDDERVARQMVAGPASSGFYLEPETDATNLTAVAAHVYRWSPARVLAEVEAKRRILDLHEPVPSHYVDGLYIRDEAGDLQCGYCAELCHSGSGLGCDQPDAPWPCPTVRILTQSYAGWPGWREEWRA